jgi:hypothetical protein
MPRLGASLETRAFSPVARCPSDLVPRRVHSSVDVVDAAQAEDAPGDSVLSPTNEAVATIPAAATARTAMSGMDMVLVSVGSGWQFPVAGLQGVLPW